MKDLQSILQGLPCEVAGPENVDIEDIVIDSRKVKPGALFVALEGIHEDGHAHIPDAIGSGARAILVQKDVTTNPVTRIRVKNTLSALAYIAARYWDHPSRRLRMVGITGTNGKTTTSYLIESIFSAAGWRTGVMGTINYRFENQIKPAPNTTPFASELQRFLGDLVQESADACVMEVSSHALETGRVDGVDFDTAVFTNLTQDHLDYHKTMEAYAAAKIKLFTSMNPKSSKTFPKGAVINADDPRGAQMTPPTGVPTLRYRLHGPADVFAKNLSSDATGSRFELHTPQGSVPLSLPLLGEYNVMNALAAAGAAMSQGVSLDKIVQGLERISNVPGRLERIVSPKGFTVVVDYAHTEDALRQVMTALRKLKPRRLITVFGCGGDRDRTKRPLMGEVAAEMSDEVIVTSDNPRSEEPSKIALDIEVGVRRSRSDHYDILLDRRDAIQKAFSLAAEGDIVLIAGKGHETYQILKDKTIPFDDREIARQLLTPIS